MKYKNNQNAIRATITVVLLLVLFSSVIGSRAKLEAENIDLVTLPNRDGVQLTIYNSEDITLAKEIRTISFKKGMNQLQFSWANTLIDPTSVEFQPMEKKDQIDVIDTVFPGDKPQHLIWNIKSEFEGQARVMVTYFTSGLTWKMDYVLTSNVEETGLKYRGYVSVFNRSGEEYEDAQIRLIVGKINLVEKIANLARRRGMVPPAPKSPDYRKLKKEAVWDSIDEAQEMEDAVRSNAPTGAKSIVKEGLSEYFMFTVEGYETIKNGWSKRMIAIKADDVKFDVVYRMRDYQYGSRPVRFYIWKNDKEHKLGDSPMPDGLVRIFRENGRDGLSFLGGEQVHYVPVKAKVEINLGTDDLVVYKRRKMKTERRSFEFDKNNRVKGWTEEQDWIDTIRNYRDKPITFELRRIWSGDVEYRPEQDSTLFDFRTVETIFTVEPRSKKELSASATFNMGSKTKQSRVKLR